ncbi:MAG: hypothetical protein KAV00_13430 [Phycisphaerae bacterium]|nr:hypothetical protein [Phycisphaerae bacterium]
MNKGNRKKPATRNEYDFSGGVRGKYAARYARGTNIVMLDPDVRDVFTDSKAVNQALRAIAGIVRKQAKSAPAVRKQVKPAG